MTSPYPDPGDEAVEFARDLIRIDSTNTGNPATTRGERAVAEYVAEKLREVGIECEFIEPEPGRTSLVARIQGYDLRTSAMVLHSHADVVGVPNPEAWPYPPFGGETHDGELWGRGALDMKATIAMQLAAIRRLKREGVTLPYTIIFNVNADEEAGARGATHHVDNRPEIYAGASVALGEVGGWSIDIGQDRRAYLLQTGEKGMGKATLRVKGRGGHSAMVSGDNAIVKLAEAVSRIGNYEFPIRLTPTMESMVQKLIHSFGLHDPKPFTPIRQSSQIDAVIAQLGKSGEFLRQSLRNTAVPTIITAGIQENVVPSEAECVVNCRTLPGENLTQFKQLIEELAGPDIEVEWEYFDPGWENELTPALGRAIESSLRAGDPNGIVIPYLMPASTDAHALRRTGMSCYGWCPMQLPAGFDYMGLFHGDRERIPEETIRTGVQFTWDLLTNYRPALDPPITYVMQQPSPRHRHNAERFYRPDLAAFEPWQVLEEGPEGAHAGVIHFNHDGMGHPAALAARKIPTDADQRIDLLIEPYRPPSPTADSLLALPYGYRQDTEKKAGALRALDRHLDLPAPIVCLLEIGLVSDVNRNILPEPKQLGALLPWLLQSDGIAGKEVHIHPAAGLSRWCQDIVDQSGVSATVEIHPDDAAVSSQNLWLRFPFSIAHGSSNYPPALGARAWDELSEEDRRLIEENLEEPHICTFLQNFRGLDWRTKHRINRQIFSDSPAWKEVFGTEDGRLVLATRSSAVVASRELREDDTMVNVRISPTPSPPWEDSREGDPAQGFGHHAQRLRSAFRGAKPDKGQRPITSIAPPILSIATYPVEDLKQVIPEHLGSTLMDPRLRGLPLKLNLRSRDEELRALVGEALDAEPELARRIVNLSDLAIPGSTAHRSRRPGAYRRPDPTARPSPTHNRESPGRRGIFNTQPRPAAVRRDKRPKPSWGTQAAGMKNM